jgi:ATP-dependent DNA ligase
MPMTPRARLPPRSRSTRSPGRPIRSGYSRGDARGAHPLQERKAALAKLLRRAGDGVTFNEHYTVDAAIVYKHVCALGREGIVSKRLTSPYRSGRAGCWVKVKNPAAPAVIREAEEEWN